MENVTANTPYISKYCDFDFYDLVWCHPGLHPNFNDEKRTLGRLLGVSHKFGSDMCYLIQKKSGTVIEETTVQHVTRDNMIDAQTVAQVEHTNTYINEKLDNTKIQIQHGEGGFTLEDEYDLQQYDQDLQEEQTHIRRIWCS